MTSEHAKRIVCVQRECLRTTQRCMSGTPRAPVTLNAVGIAHAPHAIVLTLIVGSAGRVSSLAAYLRLQPVLVGSSSPHHLHETSSSSAKIWGILHPQAHGSYSNAVRRSASGLCRNRPTCCEHESTVRSSHHACATSAATSHRASISTTPGRFFLQLWRGLTACIMQCRASKNIMHCARMQALRIHIDELVTTELSR
jgi:hypothetical protein